MSDEPTRTGRERRLSDLPTGQIHNPALWSLVVAGQTDKGRVRPGNEDNFGVEPPHSARAKTHGTLLIVSDGMGGHAAGEVASALAVETIRDDFYGNTGLPPAEAIRHAIQVANAAIFDSAQEHIEQAGMGCTIVVMVVQGHDLTVGHVGDSRGYLIRGGHARQITRDHSWVAMQVEEGVLTPEQAAHHPNRSLLMRALGRQESVEVEIGRHRLQDGDVLIICSDGLTGVVEDGEIAEYATRLLPAAAVEQLIALANSRGAPDNVTVVAAALHAAGPTGATGNVPTIVSATLDAPTPRLGSVAGDAPTLRPTHSRPVEQPGVTAPPLLQRTAPIGTPIVISRESVVTPDTLNLPARRGYGKLVAGLAAAVAVLLALAALIYFPNNAPSESTRSGEANPVATAAPASKPAAPQPGAPSLTLAPLPTATAAAGASGLPGAAPASTSAPTSQPAATVAPTAPGLAATVEAAATRAAGALPGLGGTPTLPTGSPVPTSVPTVGPQAPQQPPGDRAASEPAPPGGDAPAVEETMAPAEPSSAEPAPGDAPPSDSAPAPGPPPSGPRVVAPSGGFPAIPGLRPRRSDDDD